MLPDLPRTAFIEALTRNGVTVTAPAVAENPSALLPAEGDYAPDTRVASYESAPYAQVAHLILNVSLNFRVVHEALGRETPIVESFYYQRRRFSLVVFPAKVLSSLEIHSGFIRNSSSQARD